MGIEDGYYEYRAVGSVFGENSFYQETWGTKRWGRHVGNHNSDPRGSLSLVRCGFCCPLCHMGDWYSGKIVFLPGTYIYQNDQKYRNDREIPERKKIYNGMYNG